MRTPFWLSPVLFALYPVLYLYAKNTRWWTLSALPLLAGPLVGLAFLFVFLAAGVLKDRGKAGVLVTVLLILFFYYQPVYGLIAFRQFGSIHIGGHTQLLCVLGIVSLLAAAWIIKTRRDLRVVLATLTIAGASLVLMNLGLLGLHAAMSAKVHPSLLSSRPLAGLQENGRNPSPAPNIYYIILDRYPNQETLRTIYHYDNQEFLDYLTGKGFYVATQSRSNYLKTGQSLASSLNMDYINYLTSELGRDYTDWTPLNPLLQDFRLWRFLKARGYQFVQLGSEWEATARNPNADRNVNVLTPPRSFWELLWLTPLGILGQKAEIALLDPDRTKWERSRLEFRELAKVPRTKKPAFIFVHLILPHPPFVFERDGQFVTGETRRRRTREENFLNQLIYTNQQMKIVIDKILAESEVPPIIVIQGDEGPFPIRYEKNLPTFEWSEATTAELREKTGILNAYFLPQGGKDKLYPTITPVNSFRLIFNVYFGTDLERLPDETYAHGHDHRPYDFFPITERLKEK